MKVVLDTNVLVSGMMTTGGTCALMPETIRMNEVNHAV